MIWLYFFVKNKSSKRGKEKMEKLDLEEILKLPDRVRVQFINSLSGFKSANLIGTRNKVGQENLSIVSSVTHVGSNPPLLSVIFRPPSVERHSYENIIFLI